MQALTVAASTREVARGLYDALAEFRPTIAERESGMYEVVVSLRNRGDAHLVAVLGALERHVSERGSGPAHVEVEGRSYTLAAAPA